MSLLAPRARTGLLAVGIAAAWSVARPARADDDTSVDVEVRAERRSPDRAPRDPWVAGATIGRDDLGAPGLRVAELLRGQAGVQVTETGGFGSPATASIRGATAAQTPVYLAGIRLNDDVGGGSDLSQVPLWLVDRVEIYRGNAPLEADRMGIGGAIFFEPRWPRKTSAGIAGTWGSYGTRAGSAYGAAGGDRAVVLAGVRVEHADDDYRFLDDHGTLLAPTGTTVARLTNADVTTIDGWVIGRAQLSDRVTVDAFGNALSRNQGVPTLALVPSRAARASFAREMVGLRSRLWLSDATELQVQSSLLVSSATYDDPLQELALAAKEIQLRGARIEQRLALRHRVSPLLSLHGVVDASSEMLDRDDDGAAALRARRFFARAAAQALLTPGEFFVGPLVAVECHGTSLSGAPSACPLTEPIARLSAGFERGWFSMFANVGRYARVPTLGELYGMAPLVHGNDALRPESGVVVDGGVRAKHRALYASATGFLRFADDLIGFVRSAQGFALPENIAKARVAGLELQAGARLFGFAFVEGTATFLDPRDVSPDRRTVNSFLPFQSALVVSPRIGAEWRPRGLAWLGRLRGELRWNHQSSRYADAAGLAVIPEQDSLDAEVMAQLPDERASLRVRMTDLTDAPRWDVVGFPLPGRSLFVSLEAQW